MLGQLRPGRPWPYVVVGIILFLAVTLYQRDLEPLRSVVPWHFDTSVGADADSPQNDHGADQIQGGYDEGDAEMGKVDLEGGATDPFLPPEEKIPLPSITSDGHPIIELLHRADSDFHELLEKETYDRSSAARKYRERRGRHPPPGFDKWWSYATRNKAMIIEDFWDPIYDDLNPMWALDVHEMRQDVRQNNAVFKIRNGTVSHEDGQFWMPIWNDLITSIAKDLPDMDVAVNTMDESRLFIPFEKMAEYVTKEKAGRRIVPPEQVIDKFTPWSAANETARPAEFPWDGSYPMWPKASAPCAPDSPARLAEIQSDWSKPPNITLENTSNHTFKGYVSNYTLSTQLCHQPDLQGLHGYLIEPISVKTSSKLFPVLGSSKLSTNSEILFPAAMNFRDDPVYSSKDPAVPWEAKSDSMVWRGLASGGRSKVENWKGFHRHRLISMLNGTQASAIPDTSDFIDVKDLPLSQWNLNSWTGDSEGSVALGNWLKEWSSPCGFTHLNCFPNPDPINIRTCSYTDYLFSPVKEISMGEQHSHKYLVDVDGNSFSGRYRDFLLSGSLPIKATIFREWHDSRLVAWKHFVPFDNRFLDIYGIMEFFLGYPIGTGHDQLARKIAEEGRDWAKKVLRHEDMKIYTYRLLLEYARVMDENRDVLGWVEDSKMGGLRTRRVH